MLEALIMRFAALALVLGGCLPEYDNHSGPLVWPDMRGDMPGETICSGDSQGNLFRKLYVMEDNGQAASGPVLRFEGCNDDSSRLGVSTGMGDVPSVSLPKSFLDGAEHFLILEGSYTTQDGPGNVLRSYLAPGIRIADANGDSGDLHFTADEMGNVRDRIAGYLARSDVNKIDSAQGTGAEFAKRFDFAYGRMGFRVKGAEAQDVYDSTWSIAGVTDADKPTCEPRQTCCVYYGHLFDSVFAGPMYTVLDVKLEKAEFATLAVVCPNDGTGSAPSRITVQQTSRTLRYASGAAITDGDLLNKLTAPFEVPLSHGKATLIDFYPYR